MGTPSFAVPALENLIKHGYTVVACVTQPDKQRGRGNQVSFCDVKKIALENHIKVLQPVRIKRKKWVEALKELQVDLYITCAYGQILSQDILDIPTHGCINIHASLLPAYRGSSPLHRAILNGDEKTGITTMMTDIGMDTGDILLQEEMKIPVRMDIETLHDQLSLMGSELIIKTIEKLENGTLTRIKQDNQIATHAAMLSKADGIINWNDHSFKVYNMVRGLNPWPGCYTTYKNKRVKIIEAFFEEESEYDNPGVIIDSDKNGIKVACGKGALIITTLQFENKKKLAVSNCYHNMSSGTLFGEKVL